MVDPAIQPIQHPLRHRSVGQKPLGARDQVIKVQPTARRLGLLIQGQERGGKAVQRMRLTRGFQRQSTRSGLFDAQHQGVELLNPMVKCGARILGGESVNLGGLALCRVLHLVAVQEYLFQMGQIRKPWLRQVQCRKPRGGFLVICAAGHENGHKVRHQRRLIAKEGVPQKLRRAVSRIRPEQLFRLRLSQHGRKPMPRRGDLFHQRGKLLARVDRGNLGHDRGRMRV